VQVARLVLLHDRGEPVLDCCRAGLLPGAPFVQLPNKITVDDKMMKLKNTSNTMVDRPRSFAAEVTRVAREVETDGNFGGQAQICEESPPRDSGDSV
jgi:hypothetical protein